ncbi:nuclear receptor coregulator, partial [Rhizopogon vesiculosus]
MSNTIKQGSIFNVDEPQGAEQVRHETTAAHAQVEAPNSRVAHQVEENAEHAQKAAAKAAQAAQGMGSEFTGETRTAFDYLQSAAAQKTNAAAAEGQRDVHAAKDASASYLDQAKSAAENVVTSAQDYLQGSTDPQATANQQGSSTGPANTTSSLQTSASSAVGTAQQYLASAQAVAQPHIDYARTTLQPHVDKARET